MRGNHITPANIEETEPLLPKPLFEYLAAVASGGVPSSYNGPPERQACKPHNSLREHLMEAFESTWKDVAKGGCSSARTGCRSRA